MSANTAEIRPKQRSYIKCTNIDARYNAGRGLRGANMFMKVWLPGVTVFSSALQTLKISYQVLLKLASILL